MYFMGWYTARLHKTCSPEMLVSKLNVDLDVAKQIFGKLVNSETISAPNALGGEPHGRSLGRSFCAHERQGRQADDARTK